MNDIADKLGREFVCDLTLLNWKGVDYICESGLLHILGLAGVWTGLRGTAC
jgi:hypothetical protein